MLELLESSSELTLNSGLGTALHSSTSVWAGDGLLDGGNVGLELLLSRVLLGELAVVLFELLGGLDHFVNLVAAQTANRVGDCHRKEADVSCCKASKTFEIYALVMLALRPDVLSWALTLSRPLASNSKVQTSSAWPRG